MKKYSLEKRFGQWYEDSLSKIQNSEIDYKHRGFDVIKGIDYNAVLFVGLNPSYSEKESLPGSYFRDNYNHPYFKKMQEIVDFLPTCDSLSHMDLFAVRDRSQRHVDVMIHDGANIDFVNDELEIFRTVIKDTKPRMIVFVNGLVSRLVRDGWIWPLNMISENSSLGCHVLNIEGTKIPLLFSGMLNGKHALDIGSYERLKWHVRFVLDNFTPIP